MQWLYPRLADRGQLGMFQQIKTNGAAFETWSILALSGLHVQFLIWTGEKSTPPQRTTGQVPT